MHNDHLEPVDLLVDDHDTLEDCDIAAALGEWPIPNAEDPAPHPVEAIGVAEATLAARIIGLERLARLLADAAQRGGPSNWLAVLKIEDPWLYAVAVSVPGIEESYRLYHGR